MEDITKHFDLNVILKPGQPQSVYVNAYNELLMYADTRWPGLRKTDYPDDYLNTHHRIPKCIGGKDDDDNLVLLNYFAHTVAHLLLYRAYPNQIGLLYSAKIMLNLVETSKEDFDKLDLFQKIKEITNFKEEVMQAVSHRVVCTTIDMKVVRIYRSQLAAEEDGFGNSSVSRSTKEKSLSRGYLFFLYDEFEKEYPKELEEFSLMLESGKELPRLHNKDEEWIKKQSDRYSYLKGNGQVRRVIAHNDSVFCIFGSIRQALDEGFGSSNGIVRRLEDEKFTEEPYMGFYWKPYSEEAIEKLKEKGLRGVDKVQPPINHIICLTKDMSQIVRMYPDMNYKRYKADSFDKRTVAEALKGNHQSRGYLWYREDELNRPDLVEAFRKLDKLPEIRFENTSAPKEIVQLDADMNVVRVYSCVYKCECETRGKEDFRQHGVYDAVKLGKVYKNYYWRLLSKYKLDYPEKYKEYEERHKGSCKD